ncbi:Glycosyl transferase, family 2 [Aromatoleum petrolei]|nr:Glycosyl transferase, family 2 [Aromatoleum petrolei]
MIIAYEPDVEALNELVHSLFRTLEPLPHPFRVFIWDNSPLSVRDLIDGADGDRLVVMGGDGKNLGFGAAVNSVIERTQEDWYFVLNQDLRIDQGAMIRAVRAMENAGPTVAVLELAHRPCEHPKEYDPVSRDTPWFSGAAFCVTRRAFRETGGFDGRLFMYGEDVDLSFRLRSRGRSIKYLPDCAVFHDDVVGPHGQKPLQEAYDRANNILLRLKYGSALVAARGMLWLLAESLYFRFKGRKIPVLRVLSLIASRGTAMRAERLRKAQVRPKFDHWRYCRHRVGGQHVIERIAASPKVSIVIRTMNRPRMLKEAIETAWGQTHGNIEVVVVDDGDGQGKEVTDEFCASSSREIVYIRTSGAVGRSVAGNIGLARAKGDFICFLDEDDQLYADHVEVLVAHAVTRGLCVCYALAEEISAESTADGWTDGHVSVRYRQEFSRVLLWYKNYLPIQSVLFARSLFEELGGFDERLDLYEDWSLWVKYSTRCDFGFVPKVTSRYRIFTGRKARSTSFGNAYAAVALRHEYPGFAISPAEFRSMVAEYLRYRGLFCITREQFVALRDRLARFRRRFGA